jgi:dipeptidyl aminopeptidase/acylaminoacyl peptidase
MKVKSIFFSFILVLCQGLGAMAPPDTHPFSIHDMLAMQKISDAQISPNEKLIVFTLRTTDLEANRGRTDLWIVGVDGIGLRRLTSHPASDFNPRWSSRGEMVLFISTRSGSSQVWQIRVDRGEAEQFTKLPLNVGNLVVSPSGKHIAFTMEVFPECRQIECTKNKLDESAKKKSSGKIYDKIFIRHWDTWKDGRRSHVFVLPVSGGEARDVMVGMDADSPSKPFGGPEEITFTPDGKGLVFTARDVGQEEAWSTDLDLYFVPVDGSSQPKCLTEKNQATDTGPVFSPDGKTLAYLAMRRPRFEADRFRIVLCSWPGGQERVLTEDWDRSPSSLFWAKDGKTIYATASNLGQSSLFAIEVSQREVRTVVKDGRVSASGLAGKRIILGRNNLRSPEELFSVKTDGSDLKPITQINKDAITRARMGEYEQFTFKGWNDEEVYCYVVKPLDFNPQKKYPVAFLIHGGPQGSFGNNFHYRWNPQVYTGAGYTAVMVDFHGSVGYGQNFTDSISNDWGGKPLEDLKKGLKAALARYDWMDGDQVAALGASYGGYMINWIAGNWPDRFRCLINHDGNLDERAAYFNTEELWFPEWEHGGTPWTNPKGYEKHNPVNFVKNWKTPMLVIHGAFDYRVVDTQGMATFNALQRLGIPSKFLYFPDENHWVLKPHNSILWHETVISWMDKWCKQ